MSDYPFTLLDAIREETSLLDEFVKYYDELKKKDDSSLNLRGIVMRDSWVEQRRSLHRILERYENGFEYSLGIKDGKPILNKNQTTRHLERDVPAVAKAKRNLDVLVGISKGNTDG